MACDIVTTKFEQLSESSPYFPAALCATPVLSVGVGLSDNHAAREFQRNVVRAHELGLKMYLALMKVTENILAWWKPQSCLYPQN